MDGQPYEKKLADALDGFVVARDLILREIASYPTPISGCDQQYIRLISDRNRIEQAVQKLHLRPFVATPRALDETVA